MDLSDQTIHLKDGRVLGYAEYGDVRGKPLFFFHGWPSARIAASRYDAIARKFHIHIIAPDRPGYGLSDFEKDRKILDWPDDVTELADTLNIKKFAVLGVSGGGPYAVAAAYKIPSRVINLGIAVGLAPIFEWKLLKGMTIPLRVGWSQYGKYFGLRKFAVNVQYFSTKYGFEELIYIKNVFRAKADRQLLHNSELNQSIQNNYKEAFRQGIAGPLQDLTLYTSDWGFDISRIKTKTFLWYGKNDKSVPHVMSEYYYTQIRGSTLTIYPGEGHLVSVAHAEEIFKTLVS